MRFAWYAWTIPALLIATLGYAGPWMTCNLEARVMGTAEKPFPGIRVRIISVYPQRDNVECPSPDDILTFRPERADYQAMLPRRKWPRTGSVVKLRYLYLDGICKNDGNDRPCRIEHYPEGW